MAGAFSLGGCCCSTGFNCGGCSIPDGTALTFTCGATSVGLTQVASGTPAWNSPTCNEAIGSGGYYFFCQFNCFSGLSGFNIWIYGDSACSFQFYNCRPFITSTSCSPLVITYRVPVSAGGGSPDGCAFFVPPFNADETATITG